MSNSKYSPGGDAQMIAQIATAKFGGYLQMFEHHDWPERGEEMMRKVQSHVANAYGSVRAFEEHFRYGDGSGLGGDILGKVSSVWITSFWGWSPESWGTVGFTAPGRRDTIVRETTDPFVVVVYVTKTAPGAGEDVRGKITGFYLVSHVEGHRNEFTSPEHYHASPQQWVHSLKAVRAFSFLPEYRPAIDDFDASMAPRARSIAASGLRLDQWQIDKLRQLPFVEVPVYGGSFTGTGDVVFPDAGKASASNKTGVRAGPVNRSGYSVPGEPLDTPKELYALSLSGDATAWLGKPAQGRRIYKIGLSVSPKLRLETFRKMMPEGAFVWNMHRSTSADGHQPYPAFEAAVAGEGKMKDLLGKGGSWLGGEFYAATPQVLDEAWKAGRDVARSYRRQ